MNGRICLPDRNRTASRTEANRANFLLAILVKTETERVLQMFIKLWCSRGQGDSQTSGKVHLETGSRYEENKIIATRGLLEYDHDKRDYLLSCQQDGSKSTSPLSSIVFAICTVALSSYQRNNSHFIYFLVTMATVLSTWR